MSSFAPEILQNLEFMAIDAYLVKYKLLSMEECSQEYHRPFLSGAMTNKDLVRKLLPKIDKSPLWFYQALFEAVNDPKQDKHPGHSALLKILSTDEGKKKSFFAVKNKKNKQPSPHPSLLHNEVFSDPTKESETDDEDDISIKSLSVVSHSPPLMEAEYESSIKRDISYHSLNVPASFANQITSISENQPAVGVEVTNQNNNANNISQGFTVQTPKVKPRKTRPLSLTTESPTPGVTVTHQNILDYSSIKTVQESITHLQSDYKGLEKRVSDIEKVQASSDCERNNAIAIEKLQREMVQMQNELKKPEYNHNEAETYKAHIETERNEAAKAQDTLAKVTEKYEAQIKAKDEINKHLQLKNESISNQLLQSLAENKRQKELQSALQNELSHEKEKSETNQSTIKRLKDETDLLKTAKTESDSQLLEYTKKFENQLQIENELRDATKAKKAILQELAESKKQYDTLKEMFDKVKIENHDKEAMIRNLQFALDKVKQQLHAEKSIKKSPNHDDQSLQSGQPAGSKKENKNSPSLQFLAKKPQMWRLERNVVPEIMAHWQDVACHSLHYDASIITVIEKKCASDSKRCCLELFKDWLTTVNGVGPKTWKTLLTQLKEVEKLTDKVEEIIKGFKSL